MIVSRHQPKQAKCYPNLDLKYDMSDSIQESSGKSLQTFCSAEDPDTTKCFPEWLKTNTTRTLRMMLHGINYSTIHLMVYFIRYIHSVDYLLSIYYSRPHFHLRGSVGVDKLKCGRTATLLHNHIVIQTFIL